MKLKSVLSGLEGLRVKGDLEIDIPNLENNSNKIKEGDMFVAIKGFTTDGHQFIQSAIENGAKVILAQEDVDKKILKEIPEGITIITHPNTREALAKCACNFYKNPSKKIKLVGITGTKALSASAP